MSRRASAATAALVAALTAVSATAQAAAPGWSTPHTASATAVSVYAAGPNGQGVQLFGAPGAVQTRQAQMRAIKSDATQGSAVTVATGGQPGIGSAAVAVAPSGRLVAAWSLDAQQQGPIGLAAALGARTALPRSATILPSVGSTAEVATAIAPNGTGVVAWIDSGAAYAVRAATLTTGQAPVVAALQPVIPGAPESLSIGMDGAGRPTVTWTSASQAGTTIGIARGDGAGGFAPPIELPLTTAPAAGVQTFVAASGALTVIWSEAAQPGGPLTVRTATVPAGGTLGAPRTLVGGAASAPLPSAAMAANGRAAVLYALRSGSGVTPRVLLRGTSGTWGSSHTLGPSGARRIGRLNAGVDGQGRAVVLWDDGSLSGPGPTRILAARSSSSTDPPGTYHQLPQRSGDRRCATPSLILSTSGDGLGAWLCGQSATATPGQPRLARLTKAS